MGREPLQLLVAYQRVRIGNVVQGDEVHALAIEGLVGLTEELSLAARVERSVVLAGHIKRTSLTLSSLTIYLNCVRR